MDLKILLQQCMKINDKVYVDSLKEEASIYDSNNRNQLIKFIPDRIVDYDDNNLLRPLIDMWGQVFDEILLYTKKFSDILNVTYNSSDKQRDYDVFNVLQLFGFKTHTNYMFGSLVDYLLKQNVQYSSKAIQAEIWNRILNNLIYIYKTKGTKESIKAFFNCLGLNEDLIDIKEYVYFDKPFLDKKVNDVKYYELEFGNSTNSYITSTSNEFNLSGNEWSIVINVDFKNKVNDKCILDRGNQFSLYAINSSFYDDWDNKTNAGYIKLISKLSNGNTLTLTSAIGNIFDSGLQTIIVNKTLTNYELNIFRISDSNYTLSNISGASAVSTSLTSINNSTFTLGNTYNSIPKYDGSIVNFMVLNTSLTLGQKEFYAKNINAYNIIQDNFNNNVTVSWELNEVLYKNLINNEFNYNDVASRTILDSATGFVNGSSTGYSHFDNGYNYKLTSYKQYNDYRYLSGLVEYDDKISIGKSAFRNSKYLSLEINPKNIIDESFEMLLGAIDVFDYFDRNDLDTSTNTYRGLDSLRDKFFNSGIDIKNFSQLIADTEKYGVGLFNVIKQFIPASAKLLYNGVVIESPVYERNKHILRNLELTTNKTIEHIPIDINIESKRYSDINNNDNPIIANDIISKRYSDINNNDNPIIANDIISKRYSDINNNDNPIIANDIISSIEPVFSTNIDTNIQNEPQTEGIINTLDTINSDIDYNMDYIKYSDNLYKTSIFNGSITTPINTIIDNGKWDIGGSHNIFMYNNIGNTTVKYSYLDSNNDMILGTKVDIEQSYDVDRTLYTIIDLDNNISITKRLTTFYITDNNGLDLEYSLTANQNIFDKISSLLKETNNIGLEYSIIKNKIILNDGDKEILFNLQIYWNHDIKTITMQKDDFTDVAIIEQYPMITWNLGLDNHNITIANSIYNNSVPYSISSSYAVTYCRVILDLITTNLEDGLFFYFNNHGNVDGELNISYSVSGSTTSSTDYVKDFISVSQFGVSTKDIQNFKGTSTSAIATSNILFDNPLLSELKIKIPKKESKAFKLKLNKPMPIGATGNTIGSIIIKTNQYVKFIESNKIFRMYVFY